MPRSRVSCPVHGSGGALLTLANCLSTTVSITLSTIPVEAPDCHSGVGWPSVGHVAIYPHESATAPHFLALPYTDTCFASARETDIEHIVATSEAHDSGLCARDRAARARFASDLRNLTLASPRVNRHRKSGKDAAEWLPARNRCWFAARVVEVRQAYDLTIDPREAAVLEQILARCDSTDMEPMACTARPAPAGDRNEAAGDSHALAMYDDNGNGRITCKEARRHGIAPVRSDHPAYRYMRDGDGDGMVCE